MDMTMLMNLMKQLCICLVLLLIISESTNGARWRSRANKPSCKKMDFTLLLDTSSNVDREDFQYEIQYARRLVERLYIGPDNVKFAVITYGGKAQTYFDLNRYSNAADIMEVLPKIPHVGGIANVSGAIWRMRTNIFTSTSGDRRGVPNVALLISGKHSSNRQSTINEAMLAKNSGIMLFYVGKHPGTDYIELRGMVSKWDYCQVPDYWDRKISDSKADNIHWSICHFVPKDYIFIDPVNRNNVVPRRYKIDSVNRKNVVKETTVKPRTSNIDNVLFTCTFEDQSGSSTLCGMVQSTADELDWILQKGHTMSELTGPMEAFSKPYYVFIEASYPSDDGDTAILQLPRLNFNGEVCVKFACSMYGRHTGMLRLEKTDSTDVMVLWSLSGDKGEPWLSQKVQISLESDEQLQFAAVRGSGIQSDIGLDSIQVIGGRC